ncbi:ABC transporter ATP-binding protein [Brooklawnia cerclae]|uniref:Energy-coupling factor transport system ATP-binding protein n=1 Tax=Brooklawnia cerclae TaxID=349934 RepID=A0ABX0SE27_9ACTN|nr:ABC transporter ATP-binding protein [Brooklawnia cerclae]NIH56645.1 energy-coupling factor transport system ATP-binding protein [Brooklawnia cerclae]
MNNVGVPRVTSELPRPRHDEADERPVTRPTPLILMEGVSVRYDSADSWVGTPVDLCLHPGTVTLLLGPSGCGKSTLLLTMAGLIPTSAPAELRGRVLCCGTDTATAPPGQLAAHVGIVFQDPDAQIVTATLLDEVCFGLENLMAPTDEIEDRALAALRQVRLANDLRDASRAPTELSGGQRQRLAIACALALEPQVLVLDEPTANLDPLAAAEFYATVEDLRTPERAIVLVEHELDDALPLADRVVVIDKDGGVALDGTPDDVIGWHSLELRELGVWLPTATQIALRMRVDERPLPLTGDQLLSVISSLRSAGTPPAKHPGPPAAPDRRRDSAAPAVRLSQVSVGAHGRAIVCDVDLEVDAGDYVAITGVNGAGKSTLTLAMAGLIPTTSGSIELAGEPLAAMNARQIGDRIGYVFQNPEHQFVCRSVDDELAHGLRVRGLAEGRIRSIVDQALERFGLTHYAGINPFLLSHGEKRRLSVATALITEPRVLILDEPTFGQDRAQADQMLALVRDLNDTGITVIMVTHDLQLVAEHADRIVVLAGGRLLHAGPAVEALNDDALMERAGLRTPPILRTARLLAPHFPEWAGVCRLEQIPT